MLACVVLALGLGLGLGPGLYWGAVVIETSLTYLAAPASSPNFPEIFGLFRPNLSDSANYRPLACKFWCTPGLRFKRDAG